MDFFARQEEARSRTYLLVILFAAAVMCMVLAIYAGVLLLLFESKRLEIWEPELFLYVLAGVVTVVGLGSLYKICALADGGAAVAESLGGRLVAPTSSDFHERRLLNIVEEMSIASGINVPDVYILDEDGINAFAAGFSPKNAVVAVTRGCLKTLNREELQGVIAHEFSHILNGDMRLNIRLMGVLFGILMLAVIGRILLDQGGRFTERRRREGRVALLGLILLVVGYIGVFFGSIIKSAVSRQREFLADSSAVQFTRSTSGIAGALKKIGGYIGGSKITHPRAEEASHMFFAEGVQDFWSNLFASHPSLEERVKRLEPGFDGTFPAATLEGSVMDVLESGSEAHVARLAGREFYPVAKGAFGVASGEEGSAEKQSVFESVGTPRAEHLEHAQKIYREISPQIKQSLFTLSGSRSMVLAILLHREQAIREKQLSLIAAKLSADVVSEVQQALTMLEPLGPESHLPLIELALPLFRRMSKEDFSLLQELINEIIMADGQVSVQEYALSLLISQTVESFHGKVIKPAMRYTEWSEIARDAENLLSCIARFGHEHDRDGQKAFSYATHHLPTPRPLSCLELAQCDVRVFHHSLENLRKAAPDLKRDLIKSVILCVSYDDQVSTSEAELMRIIGLSLDCPVPPLLPGQAIV